MNSLTLALLSQVTAFGLVTIHSGSDYQYSSVKLASNGRLSLNGESSADFTLDSGKLTVNGQGIEITGGRLIAGDSYSTAFGQDSSDLSYASSTSFVVCPDNNNEIAFAGQGTPSDCTNAVGIALYISDSSASNSSSSAVSSSAVASSTASSGNTTAAQSTDVVEATVTETVCTKESCTGVESANGAVKNGVVFGAAAAVAAALL